MNKRWTLFDGKVADSQLGHTIATNGLGIGPTAESLAELVRRANALPDTEARLAEAVELLDELLGAMDAQRKAPSLYGLRRQRKQDALESRYNANKREAAAEDAARAFLDKVKA